MQQQQSLLMNESNKSHVCKCFVKWVVMRCFLVKINDFTANLLVSCLTDEISKTRAQTKRKCSDCCVRRRQWWWDVTSDITVSESKTQHRLYKKWHAHTVHTCTKAQTDKTHIYDWCPLSACDEWHRWRGYNVSIRLTLNWVTFSLSHRRSTAGAHV